MPKYRVILENIELAIVEIEAKDEADIKEMVEYGNDLILDKATNCVAGQDRQWKLKQLYKITEI